MKYRHLFFDLDHTLWDFEANAKETLKELYKIHDLGSRGVNDFDLFHKNYLAHNEKLWKRYRDGLIRQEELRFKRMWLSLQDFQIADEELAKTMSIQFLDLLPANNILFPHAKEVLLYLKDKQYQLHLITNGFETTQHRKLANSGLKEYFIEIITSEGSNSLKPNKEIFEFAIGKCCANKEECIMIGDSIEVDIIGAMNAGIDQVYVNHLGIDPSVKPTYIVRTLKELEDVF